ncbi:diaminopropionate ammonia-lyase [Burkholderiaceae bacterium FT117]|uniref:diaminopropionate ammonia-lyase n=1 Tax=Zeimonas sediminis TaxID=2944268 RepID=UPI002342DD45|nr:diaminopropionate ammonia-lyase [Zeimonas sediminis]MCM5570111.1 diaminopropionate ammonia-lyase [Zeimonas sediminis]
MNTLPDKIEPGAQARAVANPNAAPPSEPYGAARSEVMSAAQFRAALAEISSWPGYARTPLTGLPGLAAALGLAQVHYKDERGRFGLRSFKALGGAYAVSNVLRRKIAAAKGLAAVSSADLLSGAHDDVIRGETVTCATDGNHGRSVAWGAQLFGCGCVIFVHEAVSQGRRDAIAQYGAQVVEVKGNYDDAVRHAAQQAAANGWTVVSDTSYPGYREIPTDVMHGYGVMAAEIADQMPGGEPPTHVFVQAGVGALAAAICADFWIRWGERRPCFVVVEPLSADCVYRSLEKGEQVVVHGSLDTVMAGLACGEVSDLAWAILRGGANAAIAVDDRYALAGMRLFADPLPGDPAIVSGETGASGLAALLAARDHPGLAATLRLDANSRVLLLGSEGDTDPAIYRQVVGRAAEEVAPA